MNKSWFNGWCSVVVVVTACLVLMNVDLDAICGFELLHTLNGVRVTQKRIWKFENDKASGRMYVRDEINEMNGMSNKNERIKPKLDFFSSREKQFIAMYYF